MVEDVDYLLQDVLQQVPSGVIYSSSKDQARWCWVFVWCLDLLQDVLQQVTQGGYFLYSLEIKSMPWVLVLVRLQPARRIAG
jgi:hypothetical protein